MKYSTIVCVLAMLALYASAQGTCTSDAGCPTTGGMEMCCGYMTTGSTTIRGCIFRSQDGQTVGAARVSCSAGGSSNSSTLFEYTFFGIVMAILAIFNY
jgi:hypothetical protein